MPRPTDAARVRAKRRERLADDELAGAIALLRTGLSSDEAGERLGITGRAIRKRLAQVGLSVGELQPRRPTPELTEDELRERRLLAERQRLWERDHERNVERLAWNLRAAGGRREVRVMLTELAVAELRTEAERRRVSVSALVASVLADAGLISET